MKPFLRLAGLAIAVLLLGSCQGHGDPLASFEGSEPRFDPVRFFTGHVRSWGVIEGRSGTPDGPVTTDCRGQVDAAGVLHMRQHLVLDDGSEQDRAWEMRRAAPGQFEATANDMVGSARGEARGRAFHWEWVLATRPGNSLRDVVMEQWMYALADGTMLNRTIVRKLGFVLAEVTEHFAPQPD